MSQVETKLTDEQLLTLIESVVAKQIALLVAPLERIEQKVVKLGALFGRLNELKDLAVEKNGMIAAIHDAVTDAEVFGTLKAASQAPIEDYLAGMPLRAEK